jgi:hypothetical protein
VPGRREAETPGGIEVAVWIGDHVDLPLAAYFSDPFVRVGLGGVGHGDTVNLWVAVGEFREEAEGLLRDLRL